MIKIEFPPELREYLEGIEKRLFKIETDLEFAIGSLSSRVDYFEKKYKKLEKSIEDIQESYQGLFKDTSYLQNRLVALEKSHEKLYDCHDKLESNVEKSIKKLEESYRADYEVAKDIIFSGEQTHASILRCEAKYKELYDWVATIKVNMLTEPVLIVNVENIHKRIDELETEISTVRALGSRVYNPKKPHKCPVCEGKGFRDFINDPYTALNSPDRICKPCKGEGIVWG